MTNKELIKIDERKCVNCHACITACPVKFCNNGSGNAVQINTNMCIACGNCIPACTHNARTYTDDFSVFINDIIAGENIIVIVAPSTAASFPNMYLKLNTMFKELGVAAIFDVSFGAELTVKSYVEHFKEKENTITIAQPCPAIVSYIELYQPELIPYLAPADSPVLHTIKMIKEFYPKYRNHKIALISPCIAKKQEFEETGYGDYNIAHSSLEKFIAENNVNLNQYKETEFDNPDSERAVLFSSPGGLLRTVERYSSDIVYKTRKIEGTDIVYKYLKTLPEAIKKNKAPKLIDCLNCEYGCNSGPLTLNANKSPDETEYIINERANELKEKYLKKNSNNKQLTKESIEKTINKYWKKDLYKRTYTNKNKNVALSQPSKKQQEAIYYRMHKYTDEDIKNCSSCGYGNCEDMAFAIHNKLNKPENCHFYLENQNKTSKKELCKINLELDQWVAQRTKQLNETVEELQQTNEELTALNEKINEQNKEIIQKENRMKSMITGMGEGFAITDFNEEFIFSNNKACEIFNVPNGKLKGRNLKEFIDDTEWNRITEQSKKRKKNISSNYDLKLRFEDNTIKYLIISTSPNYNLQGKITGTIATFIDITSRRKERIKLRTINEQLNKYYTAIQQSPAVIVFTDLNANIEYVNPQFTKLTGYTSEEAISKNVKILSSGKTSKKTSSDMWKTILAGKVWTGEFINKTKTGKEFVEKAVISPIKDNSGKIINFVALKQDITKLKETEFALISSEKKYKAVLTNMDDIFYRTDINQNLVLISPSALRYTNIKTVAEMIGQNVPEIFYYNPKDRIKLLEALKNNEGRVVNYEILIKNRKNEPVTFETNSHFIFDNTGNITGVEGILRDVTEQKTAERHLKIQKQKIETAHKNITDSINYAETIQKALFSKKSLIDNYLKEYFILNKPKEKVSGDFYYITKIENNIIIAIADCTGHGVPGGFLTILGITYIHEIINRKEIDNPGKALNSLRERFKKTFRTFGSDNNNGLDIALCAIDTETNVLQYAGAYNPLIIIRNKKRIEYKATRNPIGFYPKEEDFKNNEIQLYKDDRVYLYSDGFQDQMGNKTNKKFMTKQFKELLLKIHYLPMKIQERKLNNIFEKWKGKKEQTDDVLIFGMKF